MHMLHQSELILFNNFVCLRDISAHKNNKHNAVSEHVLVEFLKSNLFLNTFMSLAFIYISLA